MDNQSGKKRSDNVFNAFARRQNDKTSNIGEIYFDSTVEILKHKRGPNDIKSLAYSTAISEFLSNPSSYANNQNYVLSVNETGDFPIFVPMPTSAPNSENVTTVTVATVGKLSFNPVYYNGPSNDGVDATLTATANGRLRDTSGSGMIDGFADFIEGDRICVRNETDPRYNGLYDIIQEGVAGVSPYILKRAPEFNQGSELFPLQVNVVSGTVNKNTILLQKTESVTVGTSSIVFEVATVRPSLSPIRFIDTATSAPLPANTFNPTTRVLTMDVEGELGEINGLFATTNSNIVGGFTTILVKDEEDSSKNRTYSVLNAGSAISRASLRELDGTANNLSFKNRIFVVSKPGSDLHGKYYFVQPTTPPLTTSSIGTAPVVFVEGSSSGGGSLAEVLALGNITGDNDIIMSPDRKLVSNSEKVSLEFCDDALVAITREGSPLILTTQNASEIDTGFFLSENYLEISRGINEFNLQPYFYLGDMDMEGLPFVELGLRNTLYGYASKSLYDLGNIMTSAESFDSSSVYSAIYQLMNTTPGGADYNLLVSVSDSDTSINKEFLLDIDPLKYLQLGHNSLQDWSEPVFENAVVLKNQIEFSSPVAGQDLQQYYKHELHLLGAKYLGDINNNEEKNIYFPSDLTTNKVYNRSILEWDAIDFNGYHMYNETLDSEIGYSKQIYKQDPHFTIFTQLTQTSDRVQYISNYSDGDPYEGGLEIDVYGNYDGTRLYGVNGGNSRNSQVVVYPNQVYLESRSDTSGQDSSIHVSPEQITSDSGLYSFTIDAGNNRQTYLLMEDDHSQFFTYYVYGGDIFTGGLEIDPLGDYNSTRLFNMKNGTVNSQIAVFEDGMTFLADNVRMQSYSGTLNFILMAPVYADNAAAISGGAVVDSVYRTATGEVRIVV